MDMAADPWFGIKFDEVNDIMLGEKSARERFETWDDRTNTMRVVPGQYEVMVGKSSADKDLQTLKVNL